MSMTMGFIPQKIEGPNFNFSTCLLSFPYDSLEIKEMKGESRNNWYNTLNLYVGRRETGDSLKVKLRPIEDGELKPCKTLAPSPGLTRVYIIELKEIE